MVGSSWNVCDNVYYIYLNTMFPTLSSLKFPLSCRMLQQPRSPTIRYAQGHNFEGGSTDHMYTYMHIFNNPFPTLGNSNIFYLKTNRMSVTARNSGLTHGLDTLSSICFFFQPFWPGQGSANKSTCTETEEDDEVSGNGRLASRIIGSCQLRQFFSPVVPFSINGHTLYNF